MERIVNLSFIKLDISSSDLLMSNEFIEELIRAETTINWLDGWQISEVKEATANTFNVASDRGHLNRPK